MEEKDKERACLEGRVLLIEPMTQEDVDEVSQVERRCFTNPWPVAAYRRELRSPQQNYYAVLRDTAVGSNGNGALALNGFRQRFALWAQGHPQNEKKAPIIGFAGMWIIFEEAHVTTIGVAPEYRGRGLGELLFMDLVEEAQRRGATWLTLEVRVTNMTAQNLYRKYGFSIQGRRPRYYSDNNEDAFIMWSESLKDPDYLKRIAQLKRGIERRMKFDTEIPTPS